VKWASCFSGIGAPELAWADLWGPPAWIAETDRFCSAVLAHHWPDAPNLGDVAAPDFAERARDHGPVDLLIAGTPCQSFSVAGKRLGLDDPRGNLALVYLRVARELRPRWLVFENVPGLLSNWSGASADEIPPGQPGQSGGFMEFIENSDFAAFLSTLRDSGYLGCWRVLDAQYFGVPQRRRRVFVVGYLGDWRPSAAVLFEPESLSGHPAPRRAAGQGVADPITASLGKHGGAAAGKDGRMRNAVLAYGGNRTRGPLDVATARTAHTGAHGRQDFASETFVCHALTAEGADASEDGMDQSILRGPPLVPVQCDGGNVGTHLPSLRRGDGGITSGVPAIAFSCKTEDNYGLSEEADTVALLRTLRQAVGAQAFQEWGLGVVASLPAPEILRSFLHGRGVRCPTEPKHGLVDYALAFAQGCPEGVVLSLWRAGCLGRPPQGWRPSEQLAGELGAALSLLPYAPSPAARLVRCLRKADEGSRLLRQALSTLEEVGQSDGGQGQPTHGTYAVRRLTVEECEALQGFPRGFTRIPWRGRPAEDCPDGPRYRAIGNAMAVPVMGWIGRRIDDFEANAEPLLAEVG